MPTSLFAEMERSGGCSVSGGGGNGGGELEGQRALQLALELSMLGFNSDGENCSTEIIVNGNGSQQQHLPHQNSNLNFDLDNRNKKSQNMTECVPVPSSEHVAEIVGRQGCKIKALRAKTNTYIKTPVRGEEPVFVVTGRKEDVNMAKREILSAAEHFSQIRASRKNNMNGSLAPGPPSNVPGQTTIQVRVPYRVVGLVVGPKGATIKRIQQQTHTYIVTPSRDKEPVFEVTGLPDNVETARKEIEAHIAMRTGGGLGDGQNDSNSIDFKTNSLDYGSVAGNELVNSLYKTTANLNGLNALNSAFSFCDSNSIMGSTHETNIFNFPSAKLTDFAQASTTFGTSGFRLYDTDEGISESPTFDPAVAPPCSMWPDLSADNRCNSANLFCGQPNHGGGSSPPVIVSSLSVNGILSVRRSSSVSGPPATPRLSPTFMDGNVISTFIDHPPARRIHSDPLCMSNFVPLQPGIDAVNVAGIKISGFASNSSSSASGSMSSSPTDSLGSTGVGSGRKVKRECLVCFECEVVAALVPCGHNLFCMECANRLCGKADSVCPVCHQPVSQAIRIYS